MGRRRVDWKLIIENGSEATKVGLDTGTRVMSNEVDYSLVELQPAEMSSSVDGMKPGIGDVLRVADVVQYGRRRK